jgi:trimeric autotransporter adhesin
MRTVTERHHSYFSPIIKENSYWLLNEHTLILPNPNNPCKIMKRVFIFAIILLSSFSTFSQVGINNACASAFNITPVTGSCPTTTYSLQNANATTGLGTTKYDAWYKFTTPANIRNVTVSIPTSPGSNLSSANFFIEAFSSNTCPSDLTGSLGVATEGATGLSLYNLSPNTEYLFRVYSTTNPTGGAASSWNYTVCVSYTSVPTNDNCSGALTLTAGTTNNTGNLSNATASGTPVGCASGTPDDDVWYKFTTGTTQRFASITVTPGATLNSHGAMIQLYSGTCGSLTSIACGQNEITIGDGLLPSTEYFIRVYSASAYSTTPAAGTVSNNFNILVSSPSSTNITAGKMNEVYRQTILSAANVLNDPWEVTYGPDNYLWVTEAKGYKLTEFILLPVPNKLCWIFHKTVPSSHHQPIRHSIASLIMALEHKVVLQVWPYILNF